MVLSDLHIGVGRSASGTWHSYEDFRWPEHLQGFLDHLSSKCGDSLDLILAGDTLELWQSVTEDCRHADENLGCTEEEAKHRLQRIVDHHAETLAAFGRFARRGSNRVYIVPGNHDAALLFPNVASSLLSSVGGPPERVVVTGDGYWLSEDRQILVEHGHQIGEDANSYGEGWPHPFGGVDEKHILRSWGEAFVQQYYNKWELKYPVIDNLAGATVGIRYGLKAEGGAGAALATGRFVRFLLFEQTLTQAAQMLETGQEPKWDLEAVRAQGDRFLVESMSTDDPIRTEAALALERGTLGLKTSDLDDEELIALCDQRASQRRSEERRGVTPTVERCPGGNLGAMTERLMRSRDRVIGDHLLATNRTLIEQGRLSPGQPFSVFIFGHTHSAEGGFKPLRRLWQPVVLNTGAWQRSADREYLETLKAERGLKDAEVLVAVDIEDLPACYSFAFVGPYLGVPNPILRYWVNSAVGWRVQEKCDWNRTQ